MMSVNVICPGARGYCLHVHAYDLELWCYSFSSRKQQEGFISPFLRVPAPPAVAGSLCGHIMVALEPLV